MSGMLNIIYKNQSLYLLAAMQLFSLSYHIEYVPNTEQRKTFAKNATRVLVYKMSLQEHLILYYSY